MSAEATSSVETPYELSGYRDAADPQIRHEAHRIFRRTRVPASQVKFETPTRHTEAVPASYAPLPPSTELRLELELQKSITAELREMHSTIAATKRAMEAKYRTFVSQSEELAKAREVTDDERKRSTDRVQSPIENEASSSEVQKIEPKW